MGEGNSTLISDGQTVRPGQTLFGGYGARPWLGAASRGVSCGVWLAGPSRTLRGHNACSPLV